MNRQKALDILNLYVKNPNLLHHAFAVEAAMRDYAKKFHEDENIWGITGLLHDFDWEIHPTQDKHPQMGENILKSLNVSNEIIRAILSHGNNTGVERITLMEKILFACDELTGLITAVALVRPSKSIFDVKVSSVKKKWGNKYFAANVNRNDIENAVKALGIDLWDHVKNVLAAMQGVADEIGLRGLNTC